MNLLGWKQEQKLPWGNFSVWPYKALLKKEKEFGIHDMRGEEIWAEIARRRASRNEWAAFTSILAAIVSAVAAVISVLHSK